MKQTDLINLHYGYMDMIRHWHSESEAYTGGDALFTALEEGWELGDTVKYQEHWHAGVRLVYVYNFTLKRDGETLVMPVVCNPYVDRMVHELGLSLISAGERKLHPVRPAQTG